MAENHAKRSIAIGIVYFCVGLAVGGFFYFAITTGWRASVEDSRWKVQSQWARNEQQWLALEEIGKKQILRHPRQPDGWENLLTAALSRGQRQQATQLLSLVRNGMPHLQHLWTKWESALNDASWQPAAPVEESSLPSLGTPMVRASADLIHYPIAGSVILTFDAPVHPYVVVRSSYYINQTNGKVVPAKLAQQAAHPNSEKLQLILSPVSTLSQTDPHRFVMDIPQQRLGGAWLPYPVVIEIPATNQQ